MSFRGIWIFALLHYPLTWSCVFQPRKRPLRVFLQSDEACSETFSNKNHMNISWCGCTRVGLMFVHTIYNYWDKLFSCKTTLSFRAVAIKAYLAGLVIYWLASQSHDVGYWTKFNLILGLLILVFGKLQLCLSLPLFFYSSLIFYHHVCWSGYTLDYLYFKSHCS